MLQLSISKTQETAKAAQMGNGEQEHGLAPASGKAVGEKYQV